MKSFVCVLLLAAVVAAEPAQFRQRYRYPRQEVESSTDREEAPYAPAGFRPEVEFNLPSRQEVYPPSTSYGVPDDSYRAPLGTYVVPQTVYGVPERKPEGGEGLENKEGEENNNSEGGDEQKVESTKEEQRVEAEKEKLEEEPKKDSEVVSAQGVYYVLLPDAQLQRVEFQTQNDVRNMAYTARLQYRSEDRAPVYVYTAVPYTSAAYVQLF